MSPSLAVKLLVFWLLCACLGLLPGCGFVTGTVLCPSPYIGTRLDVAQLSGPPAFHGFGSPLDQVLALIDLPFSFFFDTAFLPYTLMAVAIGYPGVFI